MLGVSIRYKHKLVYPHFDMQFEQPRKHYFRQIHTSLPDQGQLTCTSFVAGEHVPYVTFFLSAGNHLVSGCGSGSDMSTSVSRISDIAVRDLVYGATCRL